MERVSHLTNKIYREMLCIKSHEGNTYITMGGLVSWTPQFSTRIAISWHLLAWLSVDGRIPSSFTNFVTTPEFSGPPHISPDIYHTQITEYSLQTIISEVFSRCVDHLPNYYSFRPNPSPPYHLSWSNGPDWSFGELFPVLFQPK